MTKVLTLQSHPLDRSRVVAVYTGRRGCMCGCNGEYHYTGASRAEASKRRGYEVRDEEVDEIEVARVIDEVLAADTSVEVIEGLGEMIYYVDHLWGRCAAVYVKLPPPQGVAS